MSRNCLVVSTFFGKRRTIPSGVDETIRCLDQYIDYLAQLDSGVDSDIIIVNHRCAEEVDPEKKSLNFLSKWNNTETAHIITTTHNRYKSSHTVTI